MSILSALFDNKTYSFEHAFGVKDITSDEMKTAIRDWFGMYFAVTDEEKWDTAQRLPVTIVNKITKTVFSEYTVNVQSKTQSPKTQFMSAQLQRIDKIKKQALQQSLVGGECFVKPVVTVEGFYFTILRRDCFIPLERDNEGNITSVGTAELTIVGNSYYRLLERRTLHPNGDLQVTSKLFVSKDQSSIGTETVLTALPKYEVLQPELVLYGLGSIGMALLKTPLLNCVDGSQDGVSVFAPAIDLISRINENEYQLDREFINGASRIIASEDFIRQEGKIGEIPFPHSYRRKAHNSDLLKDELFCLMGDGPDEVGVTIFSPILREQSYLARKQEYLRNIESLIGLKRGILSEAEAVERTATEITSSAGDYNLTIKDFQDMWTDMLKELLDICNKLGEMYHLCDKTPFHVDTDLTIDWGDGVLFNRDRTWQEYQGMVAAGLLRPEIAIAWYFDLPKPETEKGYAEIRAQYMPDMAEVTEGEE